MSLAVHTVEPLLTPAQQTIYHFLTQSNSKTYTKDELMVELNLSHKGSFTRTLNQLAKQNLITLIQAEDTFYIELPHLPTTDVLINESVKDKVDETFTPIETESNTLPLVMEVEEPFVVTHEPTVLPEFDLALFETPSPSLTDELLTLANQETSTPYHETIVSSNKPVLDLEDPDLTESVTTELVPIEESLEKDLIIQTQEPLSPNLIGVIHKEADSTPSSALVLEFNKLSKKNKSLFSTLFHACLETNHWSLPNYKVYLPQSQLTSPKFPSRMQALEKSGFIQLSGKKHRKLTLNHSPLEFCEQLPDYRPLLETSKDKLQAIHQSFMSQEESLILTETKQSSSQINKNASPEVMIEIPKIASELTPETEWFENRYYLLDSENCNHFLSSSKFLKNLKPNDRFIIFLSQNSPCTNPSVLHFCLSHAHQIETRFVTVRGKGESDLDHVLTMELAYLWMNDPEAQYIILSKDQGFLASINYWTQRHQLKLNQLCLKSEL